MRYRQGFSLLELLVTLGIVVLLAALALPALSAVRMRSWAAASSSNLHQLALANVTYLADNGFYAPADDRWNNKRWHGARPSSGQPFDPTKGFLADYLGQSRRVTVCPLFFKMLKGGQSFENGTGGYGYNAAYIGGRPGGTYNGDGTRQSATLAQVSSPATTVMFTTSAYARAGGVQEYPYAEPPFWDFGDGPSGQRPSPSVHFRFNGRALVAWADAHVTMEEPTDQAVGGNPHGGDADEEKLGWFGPEENNGFWNAQK
jgi:prepilin-type N-terminal cleavage/methylation domain-containing protein